MVYYTAKKTQLLFLMTTYCRYHHDMVQYRFNVNAPFRMEENEFVNRHNLSTYIDTSYVLFHSFQSQTQISTFTLTQLRLIVWMCLWSNGRERAKRKKKVNVFQFLNTLNYEWFRSLFLQVSATNGTVHHPIESWRNDGHHVL